MRGKIALTLLVISIVGAVGQIHLRVPPIGNIFNRLTNTTFDIIRGGVNIFSKTVERIIDTFGRIEDRLRALLEEFRKQILRGIPELNIPVLDPLHIDKIEFNVTHDAADIQGNAEDITIKHISKFVVDKEKFTDLGKWRFKLDLNLTFPYLTANGKYKLDGLIGDQFKIFGNGKFWLNLIDLKVGTSTILKFEYPKLRVVGLQVNVKLRRLENNFENLMNDQETGELFNKAITKLAPEAVDLLWPEIKGPVEKQIMQYINQVLENATVANLARRLFNIR